MDQRITLVAIISAAAIVGAVIGSDDLFTTTTYQDIQYEMPVPELQQYRLVRVWTSILGIHPPFPLLLLVAPDGVAYKMPEQFQEVIRREDMVVTTSDMALDLARTYAYLTTSYGDVLVLVNATTIPGLDSNDLRELSEVSITPPRVDKRGQDFIVQLLTWKQLGGLIEQWRIIVRVDGGLQASSRQLASDIGSMIGLA